MTSPIDPELCKNTGRLLTEWFEFPEYTEEDLRAMAQEASGVDYLPRPPTHDDVSLEELEAHHKHRAFITRRKNTAWKGNMTKMEVQARLNEATKMVDPSNFKFLDDATRERTGLELNPLWMMECLVRGGVLSPKEQVAALKELAQYTHSKAPNINHNTNITASEDWLLELSKSDYAVVDESPSFQPKQRREAGMHVEYEKRREQRVELLQKTQEHMTLEVDEMANALGDFSFGDEDEE